MKTLVALALTFISLNSQAWTVETTVEVGHQGEFRDTVALFCRPDEPLCQSVCGDRNACWKEQELCFNCLGTANPVMRTVFTELDRLYRNTAKALPATEVARVFRSEHVFVAARSIYNFYSAIDSSEVRERFLRMCGTATDQPLLVLEKNKNNEPVRIKYVVCNGAGDYNQEMQVLEYAPQVNSGMNEIVLNKP